MGRRYDWRKYERIILGIASVIGWFPISWIFYFSGYILWAIFFSFSDAIAPEFELWSYIGLCIIVQLVLFGVFAYRFPHIYIIPTWLICLLGLILSVRQVILSIIGPDDPKIFLAIFALISLTILFRPALFYGRALWRRVLAHRA